MELQPTIHRVPEGDERTHFQLQIVLIKKGQGTFTGSIAEVVERDHDDQDWSIDSANPGDYLTLKAARPVTGINVLVVRAAGATGSTERRITIMPATTELAAPAARQRHGKRGSSPESIARRRAAEKAARKEANRKAREAAGGDR